MNYYISDLHLLHENVLQFDNRPFESLVQMQNIIVDKWNHKVTNGDTVYILGDVSIRGKKEDLISIVATLKGRKILIKGNHDDVSDYRYQQLFQEVVDYKEIHDSVDGQNYDLVLCHYPIFSWKKMGRGTILLYGHTHDSAEDHYFQKCLSEMNNNECRHTHIQNVTAINVGCMKSWIDYEPKSLKELLNAVRD